MRVIQVKVAGLVQVIIISLLFFKLMAIMILKKEMAVVMAVMYFTEEQVELIDYFLQTMF